jgi:hypothetical protein
MIVIKLVVWPREGPESTETLPCISIGGWPQEDWAIAPAVADEAYVTLATNDVYAVGAMVLAFTLRQTGTLRHLVVMVTPEVSHDMHVVLETVFDLVFDVWPINSDDFDNLCLLNRCELSNVTLSLAGFAVKC